MLLKTKGIVLRSIKYGDNSLICDLFTEEKGLRSYIVGGIRNKKAAIKPNLLQVMSVLDVVVYEREGKSLNRMKEAKSAFVYQQLPFEIKRGAIGLFMVELAQKSIKGSETHKELYDFLEDFFIYLDQTDLPIQNIHLYFMLHLSSFLGFFPGGEQTRQTPYFDLQQGVFIPQKAGTYSLSESLSAMVHVLKENSIEEIQQIKWPREQRNQLLLQLIDYYRYHIDNFPGLNAHEVFMEVY